ncbi:malate:quinone oxidoreductase, partial [Lentilactobacillus parakefiri]
MNTKESKTVVIIGAGVLSTTFGSMLKEIEPNWNIKLDGRSD